MMAGGVIRVLRNYAHSEQKTMNMALRNTKIDYKIIVHHRILEEVD